jgi:hypothetical protein
MDTQDIEPGRIRTFLIGVIREGGKSRRIRGCLPHLDRQLPRQQAHDPYPLL